MLSFARPTPPDHFAVDAARALSKVRAAVVARGAPEGDDFDAVWARHKAHLCSGRPLAKCVWCERVFEVGREIDVEHFRPKVKVTRWGEEPELVHDVPPKEVHVGPGYWWLAYSWRNLSPACKTCNSHWKRNLFPVEEPRGACVEGSEVAELFRLLDPAEAFRTADHFAWEGLGYVWPQSPRGRATILTCGLNRPALVELRRKKLADLEPELHTLRSAAVSEADLGRVLQRLANLGSAEAEFSGMVRWRVEQLLEMPWEEIDLGG